MKIKTNLAKFISQISKNNGEYITICQRKDNKNVLIELDYFDDRLGEIEISKEDAIKIANDILSKVGDDND